MSRHIRTLLALLCLPWALLSQRLRPGIRILMYHRVHPALGNEQLNVTPARFDAQMRFVARHTKVLPLSEAAQALRAGRIAANAVVLTFDDGYLDNLHHAVPVLQRHGLPCTFFVTSDFAEQRSQHPRYPASTERLHLNWPEVQAMAAMPGLSIGSHTVSHPYLQRIDDATVHHELRHSKAQIEQHLGQPVPFLCYPSGDAGERELQAARAAGYEGAVTVAPGINRHGVGPYALRRTEMTNKDGPLDTRLKVWGAYDLMHQVLHWRRTRQFKRLSASTPHPKVTP